MRVVRNAAVGGVAVLLGLGLVAQVHTFASTSATSSQATMHATVKVKESHDKYSFSPKKVTVKVGTQVTWKNTTDAAHTVTGQGSWSSYNKPLAASKTVSYTFKKPGTYKYFCSIHPYMRGTVIVTR